MKSKVEIYIASHKRVEIPELPPEYILVHGGAELTEKQENEIGDDSGDNISYKNPYYNEMTVIYWAWKNRKSEIKGLCHYRRFFSKSYVSHSSKYFITADNIIKDLDRYDIILQNKSCHKGLSVKECYCYNSNGQLHDIEIFREIIEEHYPDYLEAYDKVINGYIMSYYNMFICKSDLFDMYCEWLFDVLMIAEQKIDIEQRVGSQKRVLAFMAERLLNVWVEKNKLSVKYYPVVKIDRNEGKKYYVKIITEKFGLLHIYRNIQKVKYNLLKEQKTDITNE